MTDDNMKTSPHSLSRSLSLSFSHSPSFSLVCLLSLVLFRSLFVSPLVSLLLEWEKRRCEVCHEVWKNSLENS